MPQDYTAQSPKTPNMLQEYTAQSPKALTFEILDEIAGDYCDHEILVRLIHFWEARNFRKDNILIGLELLLIDSQSNAVHGFIPANRIASHEKNLKRSAVYKLKNFISSPNKKLYRVSDYKHGICFTTKTTMVPSPDETHTIADQKFRLRTFKELSAIADTNTQLFDVIGQIRLLTGDNLHSPTTMDKAPQVDGSRAKDRVLLHLLMKDGETIRIYLWGTIAGQFRTRWNESAMKPSVLLITTVNPKTSGSAFSVSSTAGTRLFFDSDIPETELYIAWLGEIGTALPTITSSSSAITKLETVTISEILTFLNNEIPQTCSFHCYATIVNFVSSSGWYYISCNSCNTKLGKNNPTSMFCENCNKENNVGLIRYRFELTVRDTNGDEAVFVVFDEDGMKLAGRRAADVVNETTEAVGQNEWQGIFNTTPECLKHIVGYACKFQVKLTSFNFRATRQTITVSRFLETNIDLNNLPTPNKLPPADTECVLIGSIGDPKRRHDSTNVGDLEKEKEDKRPRLDN